MRIQNAVYWTAVLSIIGMPMITCASPGSETPMKSRDDMNVRILKQTDSSFAVQTGEYIISYEAGAESDGWITIRRLGIDESAIAT